MQFAPFVEEMTPFLAMEVMERAMVLSREGRSIMSLAVGEPDFEPPPAALAAAKRAIEEGRTRYTESRGLRALRGAIAADCEARRGVAVDPQRVIVTSGTSPALSMVLRLLAGHGDEVLLPTPHYACYPNMIRACGATPVLVPTTAEDGYRIDVAAVRAAITPRTRALLFAAPANPTGAVQPREVVEGLADLGVPLLSDEIYDGLLYDGAQVHSPLSMSDECFVFDGFSKRYSMTGFRLGYVIVPEVAMRPMQSMHQNLHISASEFVQYAGLAALEHGEAHVADMRDKLESRRDRLVAGLRELGLGLSHSPAGAFYALADARRFGDDSLALAFKWLEEADVAVSPGLDFGPLAEGHLRFSFAVSEQTIDTAMARLSAYLA